VGHSMGGLVSRLQTLDSGDDFWHLVSDRPFDQLRAPPEVREKLHACFLFRPNPSVRRVITIGTPHRGSEASNNFTQWLTRNLIRLPQMLAEGREQLVHDNPGYFHDTALLQTRTSIDSLSPESPVFGAMLQGRRAPWVKYHNLVGEVPDENFITSLLAGSDGVVTLESAHMDDVESEIQVPADHTTIHTHPRAVLEVRRILLEHLAELAAYPNVPPPRHQMAMQPGG